MEFKDKKVYFAFRNDYLTHKSSSWNFFIEDLNIGIICLDYYKDLYKIVDEKKWLLTKIKYGI
jgi:hypothetical protein